MNVEDVLGVYRAFCLATYDVDIIDPAPDLLAHEKDWVVTSPGLRLEELPAVSAIMGQMPPIIENLWRGYAFRRFESPLFALLPTEAALFRDQTLPWIEKLMPRQWIPVATAADESPIMFASGLNREGEPVVAFTFGREEDEEKVVASNIERFMLLIVESLKWGCENPTSFYVDEDLLSRLMKIDPQVAGGSAREWWREFQEWR